MKTFKLVPEFAVHFCISVRERQAASHAFLNLYCIYRARLGGKGAAGWPAEPQGEDPHQSSAWRAAAPGREAHKGTRVRREEQRPNAMD